MPTEPCTFRISALIRLALNGPTVEQHDQLVAAARARVTKVFTSNATNTAILLHRDDLDVFLDIALGLLLWVSYLPLLEAEAAGKIDHWREVSLTAGDRAGEVVWAHHGGPPATRVGWVS